MATWQLNRDQVDRLVQQVTEVIMKTLPKDPPDGFHWDIQYSLKESGNITSAYVNDSAQVTVTARWIAVPDDPASISAKPSFGHIKA